MLAGLGFDKRSFQNLTFPEGAEIHHLDWIDPLHHFESVPGYAKRMLELQVLPEHRNKEIIFIGHSFGGVLLQEIALLLEKPKIVLLISSIKSHAEKPVWMRLLYWFPVYWLHSKFFIKITYLIWSPWYGFKTADSRKLFWEMVSRFSNKYHRWATRAISFWRPQKKSKNYAVMCIHGTKDLMFPFKNIVEPKEVIQGGNHFMVYHEAAEISIIIEKYISGIKKWTEVFTKILY